MLNEYIVSKHLILLNIFVFSGLGSTLHLHTINAELVATTSCKETINCLSYSSAPEGLSINIIAGGLSSGTIRMWSSWDLTVVRELNHNTLLATPIIR